MVKWSGNLTGVAGIAGAGAGFFYFDLTSDCVNNRIVRIKGIISTVAAGAGIKFTGEYLWGQAQLSDIWCRKNIRENRVEKVGYCLCIKLHPNPY